MGVGSRFGLGGAAPSSPRWGCLAPGTPPALEARTLAWPLAQHFPTQRHFPVRREMPSTFPLSLQLLDFQIRLCALLGVFSTAPFLPRRAELTSPTVFWLGEVGRRSLAGSVHLCPQGQCDWGIFPCRGRLMLSITPLTRQFCGEVGLFFLVR